ncbi:hypothetical protein EIP86_004221 [Pleurotus ostreatoroseus]|nr:hypothetical protein EIP86_004221 [Pleurotus ostreatoroseus]
MASFASILFGCRLVLFSAVGTYLFIIGLIGIVFPAPTCCLDLCLKRFTLCRVWCECSWVGLLWILELAGATAITVQSAFGVTCSPDTLNPDIVNNCARFQALEAFAWICTLLLFFYFVALTGLTIYHLRDDKQVWRAQIRLYPWLEIRSSLDSTVESPKRQWQKPLQLAGAPEPQTRPPPARKATLNRPSKKRDLEQGAPPPKYPETEYYSQPFAEKVEAYYNAPRPAPAPPTQMKQVPQQAPSLYPEHLRSHLPPQPQASQPAPPLPSQSQRRPAAHKQGSVDSMNSISSTSSSGWASDPAGRPRPTHPRRKGSSGSSRQRPIPPPLDLTAISAHRLIDERVSRR